jgi:hypothetical protein
MQKRTGPFWKRQNFLNEKKKIGASTNEDHLMAICILLYHRTPSDIKLCLAFLLIPTNDLGLMFGDGNVG